MPDVTNVITYCPVKYKCKFSMGLLPQSDIILTDPLPSELITQGYIDKYQITLERMKKIKNNSLLNPCPPFYRNEEVSRDVIDSDYFAG